MNDVDDEGLLTGFLAHLQRERVIGYNHLEGWRILDWKAFERECAAVDQRIKETECP